MDYINKQCFRLGWDVKAFHKLPCLEVWSLEVSHLLVTSDLVPFLCTWFCPFPVFLLWTPLPSFGKLQRGQCYSYFLGRNTVPWIITAYQLLTQSLCRAIFWNMRWCSQWNLSVFQRELTCTLEAIICSKILLVFSKYSSICRVHWWYGWGTASSTCCSPFKATSPCFF